MTSGLHAFLLRFKSLFHKRKMEREIADELAFHQSMLRDKLIRQGVPEAELDRAAQRAFGNTRRWHERLRETWQFSSMENFLRDISFSARLLKKSPGFTAVALLTLAIGIGANTSIFSLMNGLMLRPLPVPHAGRLIFINSHESDYDGLNYSFSAPIFRTLEKWPTQKKNSPFQDVAAFHVTTLQVRSGSGNVEIPGALVSGQFFPMLETPPLLGRYLTPSDDRQGGGPGGLGVVISESFWKSWFHRDPNIVGRKIVIANAPFTIVGVMPKRFIGAASTWRPQIYVPLSAEPVVDAPFSMLKDGYQASWLRVLARLKPGISLAQANAALGAVSNSVLTASIPNAKWVNRLEGRHFQLAAESGSKGFSFLRMEFKQPLLVVFALCVAMLLLACLNLASLLIARSAARERELATRLALGAAHRRLIQQLLVDSLLIAILGTAAGLAATPFVSRSLATLLLPANSNMFLDTRLDLRVVLFAVLIVGLATVLVGLVPALRATSGNLNDQIKFGSHAILARERRHWLPRILMATEVGLALVLLVGAGLLATSLARLYRTGLGFNPRGLVNLNLQMDKQPLEGDALLRWYQRFAGALAHQPGVKSVSFESIPPLSGSMEYSSFSTPLSNGTRDIDMNEVAPGYFQTMEIPMIAGRDFHWNDTTAGGLKIILNSAAAKLLFPGQNAIGHEIAEGKRTYEVIAVVGDVRYLAVQQSAPPGAYLPITQSTVKKRSYIAVVRIAGSAVPLAYAARSLTQRMAPGTPAPTMTTMAEILNDSISSERLMAMLSLFFAGCALLITAIGLYGTLAYATARRTSEIGIRMALGAQRVKVVTMVLRENAWIAVGGLAAGFVAALLASRTLASLLYGTSPRDPWVMAASVLLLGTVAIAASLMPAVRAALIEPITAIRHE